MILLFCPWKQLLNIILWCFRTHSYCDSCQPIQPQVKQRWVSNFHHLSASSTLQLTVIGFLHTICYIVSIHFNHTTTVKYLLGVPAYVGFSVTRGYFRCIVKRVQLIVLLFVLLCYYLCYCAIIQPRDWSYFQRYLCITALN